MTSRELTGQTENHLVKTWVGAKAFLVHQEVEVSLLALYQAAKQAGFNFHIASGFRSFERQKAIWNNKMSGNAPILDSDSQPLSESLLSPTDKINAILRWSALPGSSRHHWGTDFDVYDKDALPKDEMLKLEPWEYLTGHQSAFYQWLKDHLNTFGFFFPYANDLGGVAPEPWHISHRSVSRACLASLSLEALEKELNNHPILGHQEVMAELNSIYNQYITNITLE